MAMAPSSMALAFISAALLCGAAVAQMGPTAAGAPGPATEDCMTVLLNSADCLSYVEEGSNLTVPEKPCCGEIKQLVNNRPDCLCQMLAKNNSLGISFDVKKALKLPSICHVTTPDVSLCSLFGITVDVPAGAPSPSAGSDSSSPTRSVPAGSNTSPGASPPTGPNGRATTNGHHCSLASLVGAAFAVVPFVFTF